MMTSSPRAKAGKQPQMMVLPPAYLTDGIFFSYLCRKPGELQIHHLLFLAPVLLEVCLSGSGKDNILSYTLVIDRAVILIVLCIII